MNRKEAEDLIYRSYLKAEKYQNYDTKDANKRHPEFSYEILQKCSKTPCVVVTGSKGKGSVANMIAVALDTCFHVGLMTSPHLIDFCERFKVDNSQMTDNEFVDNMGKIWAEFESIEESIPQNQFISPMGIQAALALHWFLEKQTDFNVFECGKGARFDDVNNILHQYAVINSIFLEHVRELGDTLEQIAQDKSHVITGEQKCVYVAEQDTKVLEVIKARAVSLHVPLKIYGEDFWAENIRYTDQGMVFDVVICGTREACFKDIEIPLLGEHQAKNCALALALSRDVFDDLKGKCDKNKSEEFPIEQVKYALENIKWPGRMEILSRAPFVMLDACINSSSCLHVREVLSHLPYEKYIFIVGVPDDKDYAGIVRMIWDIAEQIILTKSQNPHYIFTENQRKLLDKEGIVTIWTSTLEQAFDSILNHDAPVVILGTTSVVAEVEKMWYEK